MGTCPYCGGESQIARGIFIEPDTLEVTIDGKVLHLTGRERQLFSGLYSTIPRLARKGFLMDYMYGLEPEKEEPGDTILNVYLSRLRKKLKDTRFEIETTWGIGYRLRERNGKDIERGTGKDALPSVHYSFPS